MKAFVKKNLATIVLIFLAISFVLLVWLPITNITISGDGFDYLIQKNIPKYTNFSVGFMHYFLFPGLISKYLVMLFTNNFSLYSYFALFILLLVTSLTYILILSISKRNSVSFISSVVVGINYFGVTELIATGMYAWFIERMLPMLLLLPSFIFLHLYLERRKINTLFVSIILFASCLFIFHFSTIFFIPYFLYPTLYRFYENKTKANTLNGVIVSFIYFFFAAFMIFVHQKLDAGIGPTWTIKEFILNPGAYKYPENILKQIIYWSSSETLIGVFFENITHFNKTINPVAIVNNVKLVMKHAYLIGLVYVGGFFYAYFKSQKYRAILLTSTISTLFLLFMNDYMGRYDVSVQPGFNRYLFFPTFTLAIFWAIVAMTVFNEKRKLFKYIAIGIFGVYCLLNVWLIQYHFFLNSEKETRRMNVYKCVTETRSKTKTGTTVLIEAKYMGWYDAAFMNDWWGKERVEYGINDEDWSTRVENTKNIQYLFYKNNQCILKDSF